MSKLLAYSVKLKSLNSISEKAFLATSFNGLEDVLPKSQVFGRDYDVKKSDAYWISAWILEKKNIQYSGKKRAWIDKNTGNILPDFKYKHHIPNQVNKLKIKHDQSLFKLPNKSN